jgi:hypothetical protein
MSKGRIQSVEEVEEVIVIDPDTNGVVHVMIYKHPNGGMFGIDSSFVEQESVDDVMMIPDPFDVEGKNRLLLP